nr:AcvB/VirJ family lysyl-phosphatidylglycerol hydrolase [uncultured Pedobacter sp.]
MIRSNTYRKNFLGSWCLVLLYSLSSCAILSKDRITKNRGIQKTEGQLPLIIYSSKGTAKNTMIVFLSGDGGWLDFSDNLAVAFKENGFNTVGFNSRSYFWNKKSPKQIGVDFSLLIHEYLQNFDCKNLILCGYSFGADVVPFIYNNLNFRERNKVKSLILLSPFASTDFVVYTSDLLNWGGDHRKFKVVKEVEKIKLPIACYYGAEETPKPLSVINKKRFRFVELEGGHKYAESAIPIIISNLLIQDGKTKQE